MIQYIMLFRTKEGLQTWSEGKYKSRQEAEQEAEEYCSRYDSELVLIIPGNLIRQAEQLPKPRNQTRNPQSYGYDRYASSW